ncbi:MAG TPA: phosphoribosylglycinamide formyltransferase [Firmicutes bacterium]|nr:phosphoribosylglycinamide formyltransferase [Bacillota bacterium]
MTMSEVVDKLNKKHDRQDTLQNFSGKLRRESFKYTEVEEILDVIRCRIEWNKK